jgi:putative effector of murein hydrolase LrgA (UPF0299 family)
VSFNRRLKFATVVIISQLLLIALGIAWVVHMVLIWKNGAVQFIEENPVILLAEIAVTTLITLFAVAVLAIQIHRLGERRRGERRRDDDSGKVR